MWASGHNGNISLVAHGYTRPRIRHELAGHSSCKSETAETDTAHIIGRRLIREMRSTTR
jgi:hypothetical protein